MLTLDLLYDPYSTLRRLRREDVEGYEDSTMIRNGRRPSKEILPRVVKEV